MNATRVLLWFLSAAAVLGFASCSDRLPSQPGAGTVESQASSGPVSASLLQASRARWSDSHVDSYRYRFRWECFCGANYVRTVDITVTRGAVTSVTEAETGKPLTREEVAGYRTIEGLFDFVRGAIDHSAASVNGAFDPGLGFPSAVNVDYVAGMADDEIGFRIYSLTPATRFLR
jgi:hypothetical protein